MLDKIHEQLNGRKVEAVKHIDSDITLVFEDCRLWVSTPWRLEKDGEVIVGSGNLVEALSHEDYQADYEDYLELAQSHILDATISLQFSDYCELIIPLSTGYTFRTFQDYGDDAENFQFYTDRGRYLVYPNKVDFEES